jgi:hypothetical protein
MTGFTRCDGRKETSRATRDKTDSASTPKNEERKWMEVDRPDRPEAPRIAIGET